MPETTSGMLARVVLYADADTVGGDIADWVGPDPGGLERAAAFYRRVAQVLDDAVLDAADHAARTTPGRT